jgi:hypothetical protein
LPHQSHARIIRYGYAFYASDESGRPIEEQFNHDVIIRFPYDGDDFAGLDHRIKPAYFSTTTNQWTFPERYSVNPGQKIITMAIEHFTNFALVTDQTESRIFLPVVTNACPRACPAVSK